MGETLPVAVDMAVRECIEQNILREFLVKHQAEVIGMILEEFNMKEFLEMDRRDEFAAGREEGLKQGIEQGIKYEHGCEEFPYGFGNGMQGAGHYGGRLSYCQGKERVNCNISR